MPNRDPRTDPRVGDVVRIQHLEDREVTEILPDGRVRWKSAWNTSCYSLSTWRCWVKHGEVVKVAEEGEESNA